MKGPAAKAIWTERLILLPLTVAYAAPMATILADPALHSFIGGVPLSPVERRERYERLVMGSPDPDVGWLNWVIQLRADGVLASRAAGAPRRRAHPEHAASAAVATAAGFRPTEHEHDGEVRWELTQP